jgi:ABC-2 type transport system ATP-binding protein
VAEGTSAEIKARTAQRKIRCFTSLRPSEIELITQVSSVSEQEGRIEIRTSQVEPVLREMFIRDPNLFGLEVSNSTLEEAFLKIVETGNQEAAQEVTA